jgi:anti-sigma regulatory factor (Ser/Thr protein kinase)
MNRSAALRVQDKSAVAEARRVCLACADHLDWNEADRSNAAIVATELTSNLLKHARDGLIAIGCRADADATRLDFLAVDHGPGMADVERCRVDGFSTAGSPGTGLGAIARLTDRHDVLSSAEGTVVAAEINRGGRSDVHSAVLNVSGLVVPKEGESSSGDGWECRSGPGTLTVLVCDGLGHGHFANEATLAAVRAFSETEWTSPKDAMAAIDVVLRPTRGAAAAVARIDAAAGTLRYCGVGNIAGVIVSDAGSRHLVSRSGILGHSTGRRGAPLTGLALTPMSELEYPWSSDSVLVLHSDGVATRWRPERWPGLWRRSPGIIAGAMLRDCGRGNDDAVIVAVRQE